MELLDNLRKKQDEEFDKICTHSDLCENQNVKGYINRCICEKMKIKNFIDQVRSETAEAVAKDEIKKALSFLPRKFWEDDDHAVGGYISKKDLYKLIINQKHE